MEMRGVGEKERVCVTGAGGYVASWLVKFLLQKGYIVHGTVRDPCDKKNAHLKDFENASENLQLFKADLLDYEGLCAAIDGCSGIFHVACPVPAGTVANPEVDLIEPSVVGTRNVLNAGLKAKAKRVVVVSSIGAVIVNPNWPKDTAMDEECWSDRDSCKTTKKMQALANKLKDMYPNYNYPKSFTEVDDSEKLSSKKLQDLGWKYRPLEESIVDSVMNYEERGLLLKK